MSDKAIKQLRISPGGMVFTAFLNDPLEPPSSATVTIAVTSQFAAFNPYNRMGKPVPPPMTVTFGRLFVIGGF
jgi:hypothetical protein